MLLFCEDCGKRVKSIGDHCSCGMQCVKLVGGKMDGQATFVSSNVNVLLDNGEAYKRQPLSDEFHLLKQEESAP